MTARRAPERLETERCYALRPGEAQRQAFARVYTNPVATATLGGMRDAAWIDARFDALRRHWDEHGFGYWFWYERGSGRHLGHAGLGVYGGLGRPEVELGYGLHPDAWGGGFALEAARRVVQVAFGDLGLESIVSFTLPFNRASRRVMEKLGLEFEKNCWHAELPHVLYRIRA